MQIVNWELRKQGDKDPRWRQGSRVAKRILDSSDPGYRYWKSENVQSSRIRASNANMVAYTEICALPVTPLEIEDTDKLFSWLLEGSEKDVRQIHGGTGVSPKLMHIFAQITQLSARMEKVRCPWVLNGNMQANMTPEPQIHHHTACCGGVGVSTELLQAMVGNLEGLRQCAPASRRLCTRRQRHGQRRGHGHRLDRRDVGASGEDLLVLPLLSVSPIVQFAVRAVLIRIQIASASHQRTIELGASAPLS